MFILPSKAPKTSVLVHYACHIKMLQDTKKFTSTSLTHYIILFSWASACYSLIPFLKQHRENNRSDRDKREMQVFKIHS